MSSFYEKFLRYKLKSNKIKLKYAKNRVFGLHFFVHIFAVYISNVRPNKFLEFGNLLYFVFGLFISSFASHFSIQIIAFLGYPVSPDPFFSAYVAGNKIRFRIYFFHLLFLCFLREFAFLYARATITY